MNPPRVLVATTLARYVTDRSDTSEAWLFNADEMRGPNPGLVHHFAAIEVDGRGLDDSFMPLLDRMRRLGQSRHWTYRLDDQRGAATDSRIRHICMGRNLITEYAIEIGADWILHLDADISAPADAITKLLELNHPIVGGHVPTYVLHGRTVEGYPAEWDVQSHMNTAGFLMVHRELFRQLRWRWDPELGMTDDPCYHADALALGYPTYVRHDLVGRHHPETISPIEQRYEGRDLTLS